MWIHEGFTTYSENLYVEYFLVKKQVLNTLLAPEKVFQILNQLSLVSMELIEKAQEIFTLKGLMYFIH